MIQIVYRGRHTQHLIDDHLYVRHIHGLAAVDVAIRRSLNDDGGATARIQRVALAIGCCAVRHGQRSRAVRETAVHRERGVSYRPRSDDILVDAAGQQPYAPGNRTARDRLTGRGQRRSRTHRNKRELCAVEGKVSLEASGGSGIRQRQLNRDLNVLSREATLTSSGNQHGKW